MADVQDMLKEVFGGRRHRIIKCSEPVGAPFFWPTIIAQASDSGGELPAGA